MWEGFFGAILGGILALAGACLQSHISAKKELELYERQKKDEQRAHLRQKREETYLNIMSFLTNMEYKIMTADELKKVSVVLRSTADLYASKAVIGAFNDYIALRLKLRSEGKDPTNHATSDSITRIIQQEMKMDL